jgi:hypothetical protein
MALFLGSRNLRSLNINPSIGYGAKFVNDSILIVKMNGARAVSNSSEGCLTDPRGWFRDANGPSLNFKGTGGSFHLLATSTDYIIIFYFILVIFISLILLEFSIPSCWG